MMSVIQTIEELDAVLHWRNKHAIAIKERDALQLLLNDRDEQLHTLEQSRRSHFDNAQAAERRIDDLLAEIATVRQGPCKMIVGDELP